MNLIRLIIDAAGTLVTVFYMLAVRKTVSGGQMDTTPLSRSQKIIVLILVAISPLVAGALFYYGWIKRLPKKAKTANIYSFVVAIIEIIFVLLLIK